MPATSLPSTPKAQDIVAANVQALIHQIAEGRSEALSIYLSAMGRFHRYSFGNVMEITRQFPDATRVAGFQTWKKLGRSVSKGEKGIRILAPITKGRRGDQDNLRVQQAQEGSMAVSTSTPSESRTGSQLMGWRNAYVFDISQTSGVDLPQFSGEATGDVGPMLERLEAFIKAEGIVMEYSDSIAPALGLSYGGRIVIAAGQTPAETFTTLVHELGHELLHKTAVSRKVSTKTTRETEAESIAFAVGKGIGLDMGNASSDYVLLYHGDVAALTESLTAIQRTATMILSVLLAEDNAVEDALSSAGEVAAEYHPDIPLGIAA